MRIGISLLSQGQEQFTGTSRYVNELVRALANQGEVDLEILASRGSAAPSTVDPATVTVRVVGSKRFAGSGPTRAAAIAAGMLFSRRFARGFTPAVEAVQYPLTIPLPKVNLPTLVNLHDIQHRDYPQFFSWPQIRWRSALYDRAARKATLVLTLSEHSRRKIVQYLGIPADRVIAIPMAVDFNRFGTEPAPSEEDRIAALGLSERFLFYPASLWPHKNHDRLLTAFARLEDPDLQLVLTGATFDRLEGLTARAAELGVADRIRHLGYLSEAELPALYRRATALVFPSLYEGFGTPPLEAMACGCPVASSYATALAEVCGDAAVELEPGSIDQMSDALHRITSDDRLRRELRERGLGQAARFSWTRVAQLHLEAYRLAVSCSGR
jgi:glycosyltransferase involved in cell wall biosynthesis